MSKLQTKKIQVVKVTNTRGAVVATAKGGASFTEAFGCKTRLWSDAKKLLPRRRDPKQGFATETWFSALVHGLLAGGQGFTATESMRGDAPLLTLLGLQKAPSAETVEEVTKYLARPDVPGHAALAEMLQLQAARLLHLEKRADLLWHGFLPVWGDGTLLETDGKTKDARVCIGGKWGQMACAVFVGPYAVATDFSRPLEAPAERPKSEGELVVTRRIMTAAKRVLKDTGLTKDALFLLDSLYGEDPTLTFLESLDGAHHIVGANKLTLTQKLLQEQPEQQWRDTTAAATKKLGWSESGVLTASIQCTGWEKKRVLVGRRYKLEGEAIWNYSGVITNLTPEDPRIAAAMAKWKLSFEETVWRFYGHKQGMENQWKDILTGMGLHTMPSGKAATNAIFLAVAALALGLKTGCVRMGLEKPGMTLVRFRREVIDVAASVARHAGQVVATLLDARDWICREIDVGMGRLALL